ncbi:virulence factor SrfB [Elioraea rosea]|uniref:virulence factor SrfB n=1 Tax=Elioraea rosea TaxID=2492390 RepID=UPI001184B753|nr:virulence factor SrfB [Elioraea rosea]
MPAEAPSFQTRPLVSLVPQSGIQIVDLRCDLAALPRLTRPFWEEELREDLGPDGRPRIILRALEADPDGTLFDPVTGTRPPEDRIYQIGRTQALELALGTWTPLPYFQVKGPRPDGGLALEDGPTNWARIRIAPLAAPDRAGNTHAITLAFDTGLIPRGRPYVALAPTAEETEYALAVEGAQNAWFLKELWVDQWLDANFREARQAARGGRPLRPEDLPWRAEHWARMLTLLAILDEWGRLPRVKVMASAGPVAAYRPIDVDLVLDIGNARTCGVVVEDHPDRPLDFNNGYVLRLRDLSAPENLYEQPFESRVEFARASFGRDALSRRSGRPSAFHWANPVRVGPEAVRLSADARGNEGATGLSSPKRYLWDTRPTALAWRFNGLGADGTTTEPPVSGPFMEHVSEEGEVLETIRHRLSAGSRARFSRSSLTTFLLTEILMQAAVQMNAPDIRAARGSVHVPRRLRRLVLTLPPAMPLAEQRILKDRARAAVDLAWRLMGWSDEGADAALPRPAQKPEIIANLDEATATQLVWLYNECRWKLRSDPKLLFGLKGRVRAGYGPAPSLRIASIDIGGGTTDLMIATYTAGEGQAITPKQNFREGFRIAGDEVLQAVIQTILLPQLEAALASAGTTGPKALLRELLAGARAGQSEQERHLARQFVQLVLEPIGIAILRAYEGLRGREGGEVLRDSAAAILAGLPAGARAIAHLEDQASARGAKGFVLGEVVFAAGAAQVDAVVGAALGPVLAELTEVVHAFDVDVLLLSGRPSRLRAVKDIVTSRLPVPPHKVVPMDGYAIEQWFPFRDASGHVSDPKTTAAVGAMISATAEGRLEGFLLRASKLGMTSTARYIGLMDQTGQIRDANVLLREADLAARPQGDAVSFRIPFAAPAFLGFRQLDLERWTATRLYRMEFANPASVRRLALPLTVTVERAEVDPERADAELRREDFRISEVVDAEGDNLRTSEVTLRLQTLEEEAGYWRDTGALSVP